MIKSKVYSFILLIISISSRCFSRRLNEKAEYNDYENLRYVAFGTSVTYGSTVTKNETYMHLLSPTSKNLAMRASDPSYPSICTQSMIGDKKFDVIIVEYERRYEMGLANLVKRLRERFIDGLIIVTNVWTFMNIEVEDESGKILPFRNWLRNNGYPNNSPEARDFVEMSNVTFSFKNNRQNTERDEYIAKLPDEYGVRIFSWSKRGKNMKDIILRYMPLYSADFVHWSPTGHRFAAFYIMKMIKEEKTIGSDRVGSWGEGDVCRKWLSSGKIDESVNTNGVMEQFDDRYGGKFGLNFPMKDGEITINNPFDSPRELALSYMTTGPAPSIYPKTKLSIEMSNQEPIVVDPTDTFYDYPVHVQFTVVIGEINPGLNKILIEPLEVKQKPFRLVGYSITNESKNMSRMYDKPIPETESE